MFASLSIATTGMHAAAKRIEASASNVANARTNGPLPDTPPNRPVERADDVRSVYQPIDVVQVSISGGGVAARFTERLPAYQPVYDPTSPDANEDGLLAAPNVDLAREISDQIMAVAMFQASVKVFTVASDMTKTLIDAKA